MKHRYHRRTLLLIIIPTCVLCCISLPNSSLLGRVQSKTLHQSCNCPCCMMHVASLSGVAVLKRMILATIGLVLSQAPLMCLHTYRSDRTISCCTTPQCHYTYTHTYTRAHTRTRAHIRMHTSMHARTHKYTHTHTCTHAHIFIGLLACRSRKE